MRNTSSLPLFFVATLILAASAAPSLINATSEYTLQFSQMSVQKQCAAVREHCKMRERIESNRTESNRNRVTV